MATSTNEKDVNFTYDKTKETTMREFFDQYRTTLPQLVIITEGHDNGESCEDMSSDEVYWIHKLSKQCRVMAETADNDNTYLSIPVQTDTKFFVVRESGIGNIPQTLAEILIENNDFPIKILKESDAKTTLTLREAYIEFYLAGNCLSEGRLLEVPVYTALSSVIKCAIITGIEGKSQVEFQEKLREFSNLISQRNIKFDLTAGSKGTRQYQNPPFTGTGLAQRDSSYCVIECSSTKDHLYMEPCDIQIQPSLPKRKEFIGIINKEKRVYVKTLDNTKTPLVDMQSSVMSAAKNTCASTGESDKGKKQYHDRKCKRQPPPSVHQVHSIGLQRYEREKTQPPALPPRVPVRPADRQMHERERDEYGVQENRTFTIQPQPVPSRSRAHFEDKQRYEPDGEETDIQRNQESSKHNLHEPLVHVKGANVQEDLESMSVIDVKSRLEQLGIRTKVVKTFEKRRIDGKTLKNPSLTDDILRKEFKLEEIDLIKLRQYINIGHIPK
ncbi:uncharacterized protein LOC117316759 [Pecten maximus]|uniref:uncharacterized protein LOC117316759 n=1 Tax=Pecten maximus TaxID=6579 RepID=UPI00145850AC|nr:uncharacterized protein LOC117316759 [Pecten maximus]